MKQELDEKLCKDFPKLYRQRNFPMQQTCMYWGFSCGDGWYDIIYDLSKKLEALIEKELSESDHDTCFCGCGEKDHNEKGKCTAVHKFTYHIDAYRYYVIPKSKLVYAWKRSCRRLFDVINTGLRFVSPILHKRVRCKCTKYEKYHSSASQVKEKFGTLRFYMDGYTDEIGELVNEAEEKSAKICEACGAPGKLRGNVWVNTLCDKCYTRKYDEK